MKRYRVQWNHIHPQWCEIHASSNKEAVRLVRAGKYIPGTVDSEAGKNDWKTVEVEEVKK